jgi:hypothetical protein
MLRVPKNRSPACPPRASAGCIDVGAVVVVDRIRQAATTAKRQTDMSEASHKYCGPTQIERAWYETSTHVLGLTDAAAHRGVLGDQRWRQRDRLGDVFQFHEQRRLRPVLRAYFRFRPAKPVVGDVQAG